jgi:hypothetical protein
VSEDRRQRAEDRGVGKKVGSREGEKVKLNQDRGQMTEGRRKSAVIGD